MGNGILTINCGFSLLRSTQTICPLYYSIVNKKAISSVQYPSLLTNLSDLCLLSFKSKFIDFTVVLWSNIRKFKPLLILILYLSMISSMSFRGNLWDSEYQSMDEYCWQMKWVLVKLFNLLLLHIYTGMSGLFWLYAPPLSGIIGKIRSSNGIARK